MCLKELLYGSRRKAGKACSKSISLRAYKTFVIDIVLIAPMILTIEKYGLFAFQRGILDRMYSDNLIEPMSNGEETFKYFYTRLMDCFVIKRSMLKFATFKLSLNEVLISIHGMGLLINLDKANFIFFLPKSSFFGRDHFSTILPDFYKIQEKNQDFDLLQKYENYNISQLCELFKKGSR
ncbi:hypothetical protein BpHYR1_040938 [Brachionus plicatilis]|uniref:Uncharacterized protein n=1 Tax=Brachionus plicatilis TaxID=10195 RepID=A0A3M7SU05_BRAPC|nr:hypothetical protein BpHYR1_040938 [Brachionus plicatilis]